MIDVQGNRWIKRGSYGNAVCDTRQYWRKGSDNSDPGAMQII